MSEYTDFLAGKRLRAVPHPVIRSSRGCEYLFPFQRYCVDECLRLGRAALFADCGLGKTLMQLSWASEIDGQVLLLAPLAVAHQTEREARRFGIDAAYRKNNDERRGERITITNYQRLESFDVGMFDGVVLDESSILKSFTGSTRNRLIDACRHVPYRLACTATPAPNDFTEIGNHAEFLGVMTRSEMLSMFFVHDGGSTQDWRLKGHAREEFWRWVSSWSLLFTKPSDIGFDDDGFDLPPLNVHRVLVDSEVDSCALIPGAVALDLQQRRAVRRSSLDARCEAAAKLVDSHPGQWLLWCDLNDESAALSSAIEGAVEVKGADKDEHKSAAMLGFAAGDVRVLVTKPSIAGFGMNWQNCSQMAFVGLSDSYEAFYQATRRCWRFGQTSAVDAYIIASEHERAVVDNVMAKESAHDEMKRQMVRLAKESQ